jgi:hypothetical protein
MGKEKIYTIPVTDAYKEDTGWKYSELIFELKSK